MEIQPGMVGNLGIGVPEAVPRVAAEEGILDWLTFTIEPVPIGQMPVGGLSFGATINMECLIEEPQMFDFYDGGGLDITFLGMAQIDRDGNNNVSRFGRKFPGCGGFINISQNARTVIFMGSFTNGGLETEIKDGQLKIIREGRSKKFINRVEQITYSGIYGVERGQRVLYITERAVFTLSPEGLELLEMAPAIDLEKDILDQMEFMPVIKKQPALMETALFQDVLLNLKARNQ